MRRTLVILFLSALAMGGNGELAWAQTLEPDQIEEDWQIVLDTPDPATAGPQITTTMGPVSDGSSQFFIFNMNYRDQPEFKPGGLEIEIWMGKELINTLSKGTEQCSTNGETITWTQRMKITSGTITWAIDSGSSQTFGKFGQGQQLTLTSSFPTGLNSLSQYSPDTSVANSGVGWEANRVTSMTLLEVRYYAAGKLLSTDNQARSVPLDN